MKIVVCDDEQIYLNDIETHINQYLTEHSLFADICKYLGSNDLINHIAYFDIAFLDIEMNGENGLQLGKRLREINPDIILIYITAHNNYLDDALDLGSIRFFDKPINSQRFYKGFEAAINKLNDSNIRYYVSNDSNGVLSLKASDIIYIEIKGRKTKVVTKDKPYYSKKSIKDWKSELAKSFFVSPHKSFIINTNYITQFQRDHVILDEKYYVPIAHSNRTEFKKNFMMSVGDA